MSGLGGGVHAMASILPDSVELAPRRSWPPSDLTVPWLWLQHIWALEGEREARGQEATEAQQRHALALEQVKLRDMAAADLQKKVHPFCSTSTLFQRLVQAIVLYMLV